MRLLLGFLAVLGLAACGGGTKADLPAGQHDLGDNISVAVRQVKDPLEGSEWDGHVVAVDLEYFNRGDQPVPTGLAFRVELHDSTGRDGELVTVPDLQPMGSVIPAGASSRGWQTFRITEGAKPATLVLWGDRTGADAKPIVVKV